MDGKFNRWWIVVGSIMVQMCLGAIYSWSVFKKPLEQAFNITPTQAALPFSFVLIFFALSTIIGGRWQDKVGPRIVSIAGGILLGLGMILASFSRGLPMVVFSYGVVSGIGIGIAYVCPISAGVKWFPDKRGLITGLAVFGFGLGALIVGPLARALIDSIGVFTTFRVFGISFLILVILGALILRNPPQGYVPNGWQPSAKNSGTSFDFSTREMLSTSQFYMLWLMYFIGCATGLMIIGLISPIGQELAKYTKETAALGVSLFSIFNASSRIFLGKLADTIGRVKSLFGIFLICGIAALSYNLIPTLPFLFWIGVSLVGMCFGGYLAVFPAINVDFYGTKYVGLNYGLLFTAFGVGGLLGNIFAPRVKELTGGYTLAFVITGILCLIAAILTFFVRPPKKRADQIT